MGGLMSSSVIPVAPADVPDAIAQRMLDRLGGGFVRVVIDGPECADPMGVANDLAARLPALGRPAAVIDARTFWRDASVRLEFGRHDVESLLFWLDADAVNREVLRPLGPGGSGSYLPSLRDPASNRSTRRGPSAAAPGTVLILAGSFLLGRGLDVDFTVHLAVSSAARGRRTNPEAAWTLPAHDEYDATVTPAQLADVTIRWDDPRHPALVL
jgi:hypothetical protein